MTLEELQARLPEKWQPWAAQYGPVFLAMTADEIKAWINLILAGNVGKAYADVLAKLSDQAAVDEWGTINAEWDAANVINADKIALQKQALFGILQILLAMALAVVGL